MFNKKMSVLVSKTVPTVRELGSEVVNDIVTTLIIHKQKAAILNDVELGDAKEGLKALLEEPLPIKFPVRLAFTPRFDTKFKFPGTKNPMCEIRQIEISKPDSEKLIQLKVKVNVLDVHPDDIGIIITHQAQTVDLEISANQMELFNAKQKN